MSKMNNVPLTLYTIAMSFINKLFGSENKTTNKIVILDKTAYADAILKGGVQLVDVRTPKEYDDGHIRNAVNIDYYNTQEFLKSFEKLKRDKPLYIYCRSGARSLKAAQKLVDMGFMEIYDLKGGYMRW